MDEAYHPGSESAESADLEYSQVEFDVTDVDGRIDFDYANSIRDDLIERYGEDAVKAMRIFSPDDNGRITLKHWVRQDALDELDQITL